MTDLLAMLRHNDITLDQAYDIFEEVIDKVDRGESPPEWAKTLGLSEFEHAAKLHGAGFDDLVRLRYDGWPTVCYRCGLPLDYTQYGWWFVKGDDGTPRLRHIECPTER